MLDQQLINVQYSVKNALESRDTIYHVYQGPLPSSRSSIAKVDNARGASSFVATLNLMCNQYIHTRLCSRFRHTIQLICSHQESSILYDKLVSTLSTNALNLLSVTTADWLPIQKFFKLPSKLHYSTSIPGCAFNSDVTRHLPVLSPANISFPS